MGRLIAPFLLASFTIGGVVSIIVVLFIQATKLPDIERCHLISPSTVHCEMSDGTVQQTVLIKQHAKSTGWDTYGKPGYSGYGEKSVQDTSGN